MKAIVRDA